MLQTDNDTSTSALLSMALPKLTNQVDIVKRLEELNKWQEAQKKLLEAKQNMQRQMLGMEQKTMYQMLGLQSDEDNSEMDNSQQEVGEENSPQVKQGLEHVENTSQYEEYDENSEGFVEYEEEREGEAATETARSFEPSYKTLTSGYATEEGHEVQSQKPKKPFLKRGQGLKQRFRIDPEELRITNLPRYKYANAHPKLKIKPRKSASNTFKPTPALNPAPATKNAALLDAQEQRFQQLLISSKNVCNSTPDMKSSLISNKNTSTGSSNNSSSLPKVRFVEPSLTTKNVKECPPPAEGPPTKTQTIAWAKILDSQHIQPLPILRKPHNPPIALQTEDDIFEMLEEKANNGSFDMDSTCIKQFMARRLSEKLNDTDVIPINDQLKTKRLQPVVEARREERSFAEEDSEHNTEADEDIGQTYEDTMISSRAAAPRTAENRVRFSESHDTHEYQEEDTVTETSSMIMAESEGDHTNPEFFEQFKQALFAALQFKADQHNENESQNSVSDTTLTPKDSICSIAQTHASQKTSAELQEKTQLIKIRLQELEKEIATFKENNVQLMKAKQEHELAKALHAQEQVEAEERLKDEKIQMEIYLHDERMKIEEEKRKYEQQIKVKSQATAAKERKEMEKLREQVVQLENQLKTKESNHASAQARWRTQIRSMEREEKRLHEQIEALTKENKRLDGELLKVSRENNNKLLQEINRNIAKLAPKQTQHAATSFPDDNGPPVLPSNRTMSKTIVAAATANKNFKPSSKLPQQRSKKAQKSQNQPLKQSQPPPDTPSSEDGETTPEPSFNNSKTPKYQNPHEYLSFDEDEEDILQELQTSPGLARRNNIAGANNISSLNQGDKSPKPNKAPPSSPRDMKREILNNDGSKDIWYPNGNLKKISADGMLIRMLYYNKDIKETNINEGTVKYYYAETNTWHTTYLDGLEILEFPNGQVEHRHKNGVVEVHYPNNSVKTMDPRDDKKLEEWRFPDGTHLVQMRNGDKILSLPNGQKEIHTKLQKRREYPDGTVKIVYPDGSTETRYSNGRVRLKDKDGNLVMDTEVTT